MRCDLDELWERTQTPDQHARWDLRFSTIRYLPRPDESQPQRFLYSRSVLPGVAVSGKGETVGERVREDGTRASALRFWSDERLSLIEEGSGYWRYVPVDDGIRFLTRYDYRPRWGRAGEVVDRIFFRPLIGWATAWSFDCLRLWLEDGVPPERSRRRALALGAAALVVGPLPGVPSARRCLREPPS